MKKLVLCLLIIFAILVIWRAGMGCESLQTGRALVVLHYADWCPHCRQIKPIWQDVKMQLKNQYPDIILREVDEQATPTPGIDSIPTILLTDKSGRTYKYPGGADASTLKKWILSPVH